MGFKTGIFFDYEQWNEYFGLSGPWLGGKSIRYTTSPPLQRMLGYTPLSSIVLRTNLMTASFK